MWRFVVIFIAVICSGAAGAVQNNPIGGDVVGLGGSGLQLELTTQTCIAPFSMCLGHSTAAQPANQAAVNCISECCPNAATNIHDFQDAQGNHTATGTCGAVIGFGQQDMQPNAIADGTQLLTVPKGSRIFIFGDYPVGTIFSVTVAQDPSNPAETCTVNDGFGGLGQPNPPIVVVCEPIFKNGFEK
jgi:hypothetical protein